MTETTQKRIKFTSLLLIIFLPSLLAVLLVFNKKKGESNDDYFIDCISQSRLSYSDNDAYIQISVKLDTKSKGEIAFAGHITPAGGNNQKVSRIVDISYSRPTPGTLTIRYKNTQKSVTDNVSDGLFDSMLFDTQKDFIKLFISRYQNGYIISNYFSPMIMCVDESRPSV